MATDARENELTSGDLITAIGRWRAENWERGIPLPEMVDAFAAGYVAAAADMSMKNFRLAAR